MRTDSRWGQIRRWREDDGLTFGEIAEKLNVTYQRAYTLYHRGRLERAREAGVLFWCGRCERHRTPEQCYPSPLPGSYCKECAQAYSREWRRRPKNSFARRKGRARARRALRPSSMSPETRAIILGNVRDPMP